MKAAPTTRSEPHLAASGITLIAGMAIVVVSFTVSLWSSHRRMNAVEEKADAIVERAAPNIAHLSSMRAELLRLGMYANEYLAASPELRPVSRDQIRVVRRNIASELRAYSTRAGSEGERDQANILARRLGSLEDAVETALTQAEGPETRGALLTLHGSFHPAMEALSDDLRTLIDVYARQAHDSAQQIRALRREAVAMALGFGAVSLLAALTVTLLTLRALRQRARLLEERRRLLEGRASELDAFAGRVSHDLKNSLGAMALRLMTTQRHTDTAPQTRDALEKLARYVDNMGRTIDGLLEFAQSGARPDRSAATSLRTVLDDVVAEVRSEAEQAGIELQVDPFPELFVRCTRGSLASVVGNLVRNAIKYVGTNGPLPPRIVLRVEAQGDVARVEVRDNGPGIPAGAERAIFEPYVRLPDVKQRGMGLGLATVKRVVEAYGGEVGVRPNPGGGSCFWFLVPVAPSPPQRLQPPAPSDHPDDGPAEHSVHH